MKTYKVITQHDVYIDSYENGEGKHVNFYQLISEHKAETPREAIKMHFDNTVYLPIDIEVAEVNEEGTAIHWSNLVDEKNGEPAKYQIEEWKKGEKELYCNNSCITVQEVVNVNLSL